MKQFPEGFLWGGAVAANQYEGDGMKAVKVLLSQTVQEAI